MTTRHPAHHGPTLLIGAGILLATIAAVSADQNGWPSMTGPLILATAVLVADIWQSHLRGASAVPTSTALRLASAVMLAGSIVAMRDQDLVATLIPVMGGAGWLAVANCAREARHAC